MKSLLFGADKVVAETLFSYKKWPAFSFDRAVGILGENRELLGVVLFQNWNSVNVDFSYYGDGTLTPGLVRGLAKYALEEFNCARVTTLVSKKRRRHLKTVLKFGFKYEGTQRCYYGNYDCARNTAVRLVLYRNQIERFARVSTKAEKVA